MTHVLIVNLPDIGEGVVEGEVIDWLKKEGDTLKQDEPVVIVMTDKATVELPAPKPGKLHKTYLKPGEIAIKGKPVYSIELAEGEALPIEHKEERKEERKEEQSIFEKLGINQKSAFDLLKNETTLSISIIVPIMPSKIT